MRDGTDLYWLTINPEDPSGPKIDVKFPEKIITRIYERDPVRFHHLSECVIPVLNDPLRIFWGTRELSDGGWCYVGRPKMWHIKEQAEATFPSDKVYSIYMNNNMEVYTFRADPADAEDSESPTGWKNRFRRSAWKKPT